MCVWYFPCCASCAPPETIFIFSHMECRMHILLMLDIVLPKNIHSPRISCTEFSPFLLYLPKHKQRICFSFLTIRLSSSKNACFSFLTIRLSRLTRNKCKQCKEYFFHSSLSDFQDSLEINVNNAKNIFFIPHYQTFKTH